MPSHTPSFDPNAAATPGAGIFGLPFTRAQSRVVLLPVPFDATTSYRPGTADGPSALFDASMQVDLFDRRFGRIYEQGIWMAPESDEIRKLSESASDLARPLIESGGGDPDDPAHARVLEKMNEAGAKVNQYTYDFTRAVLAEGKVPGLIGGEHSTPFGAIKAVSEKHPGLGILHVDAHMDFRDAFEGFAWSHASIMHNVISRLKDVAKLVQVGIRDFSEGEIEFGRSQTSRVVTHFDDVWAERQAVGESFLALANEAIDALPPRVYVSFDIDGLDPSMCPHTGTPVPGGFSFNQATLLLDLLRKSGREIVGFDLVEVAPGSPDEPEWDANVGARVLYKLCGLVMPR